MTLKVKQNGQWKDLTKEEWHLATDEDFTDTPNTSNFRYTGNQERIILPTHVNGVEIISYRRLFFNSTNIEKRFLISNNQNITNMSGMFGRGASLTSLDLPYLDTSKATNMSNMFEKCTSLTSLDLSSFDTSNVTSMGYMFLECTSLTSLDLSSFDTSKVTNMFSMFQDCPSLTSLDLSSFDTPNVTGMGYMFQRCPSLTSLDLSSFDTSNVTSMFSMFLGCTSLQTVYVKNQASKEKFETLAINTPEQVQFVIKGV